MKQKIELSPSKQVFFTDENGITNIGYPVQNLLDRLSENAVILYNPVTRTGLVADDNDTFCSQILEFKYSDGWYWSLKLGHVLVRVTEI